jgi:hypothetical protein
MELSSQDQRARAVRDMCAACDTYQNAKIAKLEKENVILREEIILLKEKNANSLKLIQMMTSQREETKQLLLVFKDQLKGCKQETKLPILAEQLDKLI